MWDKISDYCLDISKYFLTAVFAAALLDDFGDMHWLLYLISGLMGGALFCAGIYFDKKDKLEKQQKRKQHRFNKKRRI